MYTYFYVLYRTNACVIIFFLLIVRKGKFIYKCVELAIYECKLTGFVLVRVYKSNKEIKQFSSELNLIFF